MNKKEYLYLTLGSCGFVFIGILITAALKLSPIMYVIIWAVLSILLQITLIVIIVFINIKRSARKDDNY